MICLGWRGWRVVPAGGSMAHPARPSRCRGRWPMRTGDTNSSRNSPDAHTSVAESSGKANRIKMGTHIASATTLLRTVKGARRRHVYYLEIQGLFPRHRHDLVGYWQRHAAASGIVLFLCHDC